MTSAALLAALPTDATVVPALFRAHGAGLCIRCCLRFAGLCDEALYLLPSSELEATWAAYGAQHAQAVTPSAPICTCCLNVFDVLLAPAGREAVTATLAEAGYTTPSFVIATKIPSSVLIRQYAMLHFVQAKLTPVDLKEVLKWCITPIFAASLGGATYNAASDVSVHVHFTHPLSESEAMLLPTLRDTIMQNKKRKLDIDGFGAVSRALSGLRSLPAAIPSPPTAVQSPATLVVTVERSPVYVAGRYLKYQRGLSQTPWVLDGERMGDSSVEEAIGDVIAPEFRAKSYKFHTAGREDVDVRMLGNGRPFILELLDAKVATLSPEAFATVQNRVNAANLDVVEVRELTGATKEGFAALQSGADSKRKTYCCVVWTSGVLTPARVATLNGIVDLKVAQKTPVRVLHRRTLLTRPKVIHDARVEVLNDHYMLLRLTTSAGTYVKEFVHGDLGRTFPNVASLLGCDADILQLDVENLIDGQPGDDFDADDDE
ncbi:tRNA pseudouridine synthase [Achlya hypogyna]|uniref:tRNA pseudouridine(55) synthase n=1 Tax=Achlya hypogyna TaxID=1202772 RepID=A0A1V9Z0V9_ACHHY|nr:tRNA pseudouridine synthase [Achlya hypogyna]